MDGVVAALVLVEDRPEHARGVEVRAAVPVDRAVRADQRDRVKVSDQAVLGDREVAVDVQGRAGHGGPGTDARSAAYSWAAISAAPSTPACTPWRASRIVVLVPPPGTM